MDKIRIGNRDYSEEELERNHLQAIRRGREKLANSPKAEKVKYQAKTKRLVIDLQNGVTLFIPTRLIQIFQNADDAEIADVEIVLNGLYLRWKRLDEDLSVPNLVNGIFGTKAWMKELSSEFEIKKSKPRRRVA